MKPFTVTSKGVTVARNALEVLIDAVGCGDPPPRSTKEGYLLPGRRYGASVWFGEKFGSAAIENGVTILRRLGLNVVWRLSKPKRGRKPPVFYVRMYKWVAADSDPNNRGFD